MKNLIIFTLLLFSYNSFAKNEVIDFKKNKPLKPDEGLVVLMIDINFRLGKVSLFKEGKIFPVYAIKKLRPGVQTKIIKLPAGKYYWKEGLGYSGKYKYTLDMDKELTSFEVKKGKLNYPGTLVMTASNNENEANSIFYSFNMINKSSLVLNELKKDFHDILEKYPMVYSGLNPDPYLEYENEID